MKSVWVGDRNIMVHVERKWLGLLETKYCILVVRIVYTNARIQHVVLFKSQIN